MAKPSWKTTRLLLVPLIGLVLLVGCSSRKVATSAEDQSLLQKQGPAVSAASSEPPTGTDTSRITEPTVVPSSQPRGSSSPLGLPRDTIASTSPVASVSAGGALGDVYFDYDRFALRNDARVTLEQNARWLNSQNGMKVLIEGHCDERGTLAYNLVLGERRAQSVKWYLQELGVPPSQLQIVSYGKERPFCAEHLEACWQQNRRGHFVVKERGQ